MYVTGTVKIKGISLLTTGIFLQFIDFFQIEQFIEMVRTVADLAHKYNIVSSFGSDLRHDSDCRGQVS